MGCDCRRRGDGKGCRLAQEELEELFFDGVLEAADEGGGTGAQGAGEVVAFEGMRSPGQWTEQKRAMGFRSRRAGSQVREMGVSMAGESAMLRRAGGGVGRVRRN